MAKKPREDQPGIDGIADEYNKRVHTAAKSYFKLMQARKTAGEHESAAKSKLIEIMKEEGLETYSCKDVDITLEHTDGVKVRVEAKAESAEPE